MISISIPITSMDLNCQNIKHVYILCSLRGFSTELPSYSYTYRLLQCTQETGYKMKNTKILPVSLYNILSKVKRQIFKE